MGQILHGCARTTAALLRAIQHSQESLTRLAARYHINAKTVAKWRKRATDKDAPMGPRCPHSTVLTMEQEATIVTFLRQTLLPLDDCWVIWHKRLQRTVGICLNLSVNRV